MNLPAIWITVLAEVANGNGGNGAGGAGAGGGGSFWFYLVPLIGMLFLWQILIKSPQQRDQARRDEMLKALKKNDPVATAGGILGTVVSVSEDGTEVVVRVDDNTRLKFRRDAIREITRKDETGGDEQK